MATQTFSTTSNEKYECHSACFSWSAMWIGAFVITGLSFLFNMLSAAIGLSALSVTNGKAGIAIGSLVVLVVMSMITMFIGGYIAAYLGRRYNQSTCTGMLYGFVTWSLALLIAILTATHVGNFVTRFNHMMARDIPQMTQTQVMDINKQPTMPRMEANTPLSDEEAAGMMATVSLGGFIIFTLGAVAAILGGRYGILASLPIIPDNITTTRRDKTSL